ncbi:MAG: glycosyltransferase [Acidimicrobiales bacterium]
MRILFLHTNFPGQYRDLAPALAADPANEVVFGTGQPKHELPGVRKAPFSPHRAADAEVHPYLAPLDRAVLNGQAAFRLCRRLADEGFVPDVVCAHTGFGAGMYVRDAFPAAKLVCYFDWYYRTRGADISFLGGPDEFDEQDRRARIHTRNAPALMDLAEADWGMVTTWWQLRQHPEVFWPKISLIHDGIDTDFFAPAPGTRMRLANLDLSHEDEVITYATRGMEQYRGFPEFMRALELLQKRRPRLHAVIAGEDIVAYGRQAPGGSWKRHLLERLDLDLSRVHFVGAVTPEDMRTLLRASRAHVYLTVPFIPSWSLFEAMSTGALVVGSRTAPVEELIDDGVHGLLVDFFDHEALAERIVEAIEAPDGGAGLRAAARARIVDHFDLRRICLPLQLELIHAVVEGRTPPRQASAAWAAALELASA